MPKTHDEIKKGLWCCIKSTCEPCCPYGNAANCNFAIHLLEDALAYIRQLEAERDAAVETIYEMAKCITEDVCEWCDGVECERLCMQHTILRPGFKWRGVQKEE